MYEKQYIPSREETIKELIAENEKLNKKVKKWKKKYSALREDVDELVEINTQLSKMLIDQTMFDDTCKIISKTERCDI